MQKISEFNPINNNKDILHFELTTKAVFEAKAESESGDNWYVEAFIATTDKDTVNDVIDPQALEFAAKILKEQYQTVLFNHDKDRPIGKIIDASVRNIENNRKGLWVKILVSKTEVEIWQKIKEGVLSKFSFSAYVKRKPVYTDETETEISYYLITYMYPFECSLVSVPANPNAVALDYYVAKFLDNINKEGNNMDKNKEKEIKAKEEVKKEQKKSKPKIYIDNDTVSYAAWSGIDKTKLGVILFESGDEKAIKECFGVVPDVTKRSTWKFPHHELVKRGENSYDLVLNYNGLMAAYKAFRGARRKPNLTPDQRASLKAHLRRHFRHLVQLGDYDEIPEALKSLLPLIELEVTFNDLIELNKDIDDKNLKNFEEKIDKALDFIFMKFFEEEEKFKKEKDSGNSEEEVIEIDSNEFKEMIRKTVEEALKDVLKKSKLDVKDNIKEDKDMPKEEKEQKDVTKDLDQEKQEVEVKDKKEEVIKDKILEKVLEELSNLRKEVEELKKSPQIQGMDSQRDVSKEMDLEEYINSEEFSKLSIDKQLEFLKAIFDKVKA